MRIRTLRVLSSTRLGYRGAVLLIISLIDVLYGALLAVHLPGQVVSAATVWRDDIMPGQAWGMIWIVVGLVVGVNAFQRQDRIGYGFAIALFIAWAFIALVSALTGAVPGGWASVVIWGLAAAWVIIDSGRPEPLHSREVTVIDTEPDDPGVSS